MQSGKSGKGANSSAAVGREVGPGQSTMSFPVIRQRSKNNY